MALSADQSWDRVATGACAVTAPRAAREHRIFLVDELLCKVHPRNVEESDG
jgi:hypothetical protein